MFPRDTTLTVSLKRKLVHLLDHPGGRRVLGKISTHLAKRDVGEDVEVFYDGHLWVHRVGTYFFPDGRMFNYFANSFKLWKGLTAQYLFDATDYWFRHDRPQPGDIVFDIGAGHGEDTLAFSQTVGDTGRVFAIEAHPQSYELLETFCRLNHLSNTTALNLAVMDKAGEISMVESHDWRAHSVAFGGSLGDIRVPATTIDQICDKQGIDHIDFLKMNIEGAERYALIGMESMIRRTKSMCIACHDFIADRELGEHYRTRTFVQQFLADHGFRFESYPEDSRDFVRFHLYAFR